MTNNHNAKTPPKPRNIPGLFFCSQNPNQPTKTENEKNIFFCVVFVVFVVFNRKEIENKRVIKQNLYNI